MSEKPKVIERVKKLLALAGSANQHEAELAAAKAQELMTIHQLTAQDIAEDSTAIVPGGVFVTPKRPELWLEHLVTHVGALNGCAAFMQEGDFGWGLGVVGRPDDIAVVRALCRFLAPKVIESVKEFGNADKRRGARSMHSFAIGLVDGVVDTLTEARGDAARAVAGDQTALLVIDNRAKKAREYLSDAEAQESSPETMEVHRISRLLGRMKGRDIRLQKEIE